ncbi:glycosyltransferase family 39 protein [Candidatus Woesebacteria bacterium]|nr:glycosyltransferase family 39 protein [Candidatus Woesebacteria bacterium]
MNKKLQLTALGIIILLGFWLRISSIAHQASYWNDESNVALYARTLLQTGEATDSTGYTTGLYQSGMYYVTSLSFVVFGVNEFAGRFPSVVVGTILIAVVYIVTNELMGKKEALTAAFFTSFLQIQLAWSTQLRPYIWMELFTILIVYYCYRSAQSKRVIEKNIFIALFLSFISFLFHGIGVFNGVIIAGIILYKSLRDKHYAALGLLVVLGVATLAGILTTPFGSREMLLKYYTDTLHYRTFLLANYLWLLTGALMGTYALSKKEAQKMDLSILLAGSVAVIFILANFKVNPRHVRHSLPAFPLLYILCSVGIVWLGEILHSMLRFVQLDTKIDKKGFLSWFFALVLFCVFPLYRHKLILSPQSYYSINADVRENPLPDYKTAFAKIKTLVGDNRDIIILDSWYDRVLWYLPGQTYGWLFKNPNATSVATAEEFEALKKNRSSGIVIVENWQSLASENLQNHIRETLYHEFDQGTVVGNENDSWTISVYSWGIHDQPVENKQYLHD